MSAIASVASVAMPVFSTVTGYLNREQSLDQQAQNNAAKQQLDQDKLAAKIQSEQWRQSAATNSRVSEQESQNERQRLATERQRLAAERQQRAAETMRAGYESQTQQLFDRQATDTAIEDDAIRNRMDQTMLSANDTEQERRSALRTSLGRTTVGLAAQGIDPTDGSGAANLLGQVGASDQKRQAASEATTLRLQALTQQASATRQRNLLEQSQLADRQRLQWLSYFS
ncbi:MAG: hypothetical protein WCK65_02510 [Rhodospirillaceae bacterium]